MCLDYQLNVLYSSFFFLLIGAAEAQEQIQEVQQQNKESLQNAIRVIILGVLLYPPSLTPLDILLWPCSMLIWQMNKGMIYWLLLKDKEVS